MKGKDLLGTLSPLAGVVTGQGLFGQLADKGLLGLGPRMIASKAQEEEEKRRAMEKEQQGNTGFVQMKKGGKVSKATIQKAGFYDKDKSKSERQKIVSKVTTKPQRVAMVEKMFSTKNMKSGGVVSSASKRADGCATKGKTKGRMV